MQGRFVKDKKSPGLALAVGYLGDHTTFVRDMTKINQEMFLRYRRPAPRFRKIHLDSIGDVVYDGGLPDYTNAAVALTVLCNPVSDELFKKLEASKEWIVMLSYFSKGELSEIFRFTIDKTTDLITDRDIILSP